MDHSKGSSSKGKPRPDFPLFRHRNGQWAKKVRSKLHYFGKFSSDPQGELAIAKWLDEKDALLAGRVVRKPGTYITVADLVNHFLSFKEQLLEAGELAPRTFKRLDATCGYLVDHFGRTRPVDDIFPEDFQELRNKMAQRWGAVALGNEIGTVRQLFKFGEDNQLIERRISFGSGFNKPTIRSLRKTKIEAGRRDLSANEIKRIMAAAPPHLCTMILLGINGGLGNTELAYLPISAVDFAGKWLNYPRQKTSINRRIPLWDKTTESISEYIKLHRGKPKHERSESLLFIGRRGGDYTDKNKGTQISKAFNSACKIAGVANHTFYDLRRTFQTIGDCAKDSDAVKSIMGHSPPSNDMSNLYRQWISDDRLRDVANYIRSWLFGGKSD
jgi:integrase